MEEVKDWVVQMLGPAGDVKYQANIRGTEKQAVSMLRNLENKYRRDNA
jgi:hypothetical protein